VVTNSGALPWATATESAFRQWIEQRIVNSGAISINGVGTGLITFRDNSAVTNSGAITLTGANGIGIQTLAANSAVTNGGAISVVVGRAFPPRVPIVASQTAVRSSWAAIPHSAYGRAASAAPSSIPARSDHRDGHVLYFASAGNVFNSGT